MMLQLNPQIPVYIPHLNMKGYAFMTIDYSQDHFLHFVVALDNREIWIFDNTKIRMQDNISLGRV